MPLQETSGAASYDAFGGGAAAVPQYIEDVFSTYLYTGNGSTQTITNGIDLSTKGGLVWQKDRSQGTGYHHILQDTARGATNCLFTNLTNAQSQDSAGTGFVFNNNGFTIGTSNVKVNASGDNYTSWTFRKQPKFFDIVTYTGNGQSTARGISHNLGSRPGCIIVKRTDSTGDWWVAFDAAGNGTYLTKLKLNSTDASTGSTGLVHSSTSFTCNLIDDPSSYDVSVTNTNGATYVAYLFAHNAGGFGLTGTDNVISCGSYSGSGVAGNNISVGFEAQWVLIKRTNTAQDWFLFDNMRGMCAVGSGSSDPFLTANTSDAEVAGDYVGSTATGFVLKNTASALNASGGNYIYIAIRRGPMKVPTSGTSVFSPVAYSGTGATRTVTAGFPVDLALVKDRTNVHSTVDADRLRGAQNILYTDTTAAENSGSGRVTSFASNTSITVDADTEVNGSGANYINWAFQRAPSFFDEVCWSGSGSYPATISHNLGVAPELIITKRTSSTSNWIVYNSGFASTDGIYLNTTGAKQTFGGTVWGTMTSTTFGVGSTSGLYAAGVNYVAYLFATCAGVSKVGSYTGNGSTQTINCGFTGGARFVLIKRTDSTGDWYVYDTARGMTTLTDPYLRLNSTAAESATLGSVTTVSTGFAVNASILAAINTNAASYIFLAIS